MGRKDEEMNAEIRNEYNDFLNDVSKGKVVGLGIGEFDTSEQLAAQYLMRGYGEYEPDAIDKMLISDLEKIAVKPFGENPHDSDEYGLEWGVDVVFSGHGAQEHFEFFFRCTGHGGSL